MSPVILKNLSRRLVTIPCNSGDCRHLSAGIELEIPDYEIKGNPMVDKLIKRGVLARRGKVSNGDGVLAHKTPVKPTGHKGAKPKSAAKQAARKQAAAKPSTPEPEDAAPPDAGARGKTQ